MARLSHTCDSLERLSTTTLHSLNRALLLSVLAEEALGTTAHIPQLPVVLLQHGVMAVVPRHGEVEPHGAERLHQLEEVKRLAVHRPRGVKAVTHRGVKVVTRHGVRATKAEILRGARLLAEETPRGDPVLLEVARPGAQAGTRAEARPGAPTKELDPPGKAQIPRKVKILRGVEQAALGTVPLGEAEATPLGTEVTQTKSLTKFYILFARVSVQSYLLNIYQDIEEEILHPTFN